MNLKEIRKFEKHKDCTCNYRPSTPICEHCMNEVRRVLNELSYNRNEKLEKLEK